MNKAEYTLTELAKVLNAELHGNSCTITGIATLQNAQSGQITFLDNVKYRKYLPETKASAVILARNNLAECPTNALVMDNPYIGYATLAALFEQLPNAQHGIHPSAVIGNNCNIHPTASIGAQCVIGNNVVIGENTIIEAGCVIGDHSHIGANARLWPRVTIYYNVRVGERAIIHSGAVIGSDGFGFAHNKGQWQKIPQLGRVLIGNDVEIGANTAIDRGALDDTVINNGVKIDNLVQIDHNVTIGEHTAIAGCTAIAGSTCIGKYCAIGGSVSIAGHLTICDGVIITGGALVGQSVDTPGMYTSGVGIQPTLMWKKNLMRIYQLDEMAKRLRKLEKICINSLEKEEQT
jgi:UDP-3-O-[3-hydroxymyristoyl] glucosamine N-acyltransferase